MKANLEIPVLIVEDDPAIGELLARVVGRLGCAPILVSHAQEALEACALRKPSLAVIDVMMPDVDGTQLFARIRATPHGANLPVIFVTAVPLDQVQERVREQVGVRFLQKPIDVAQMSRHVTEMLQSLAQGGSA